MNGELLVGGELGGNAVVVKISKKGDIVVRELWENGGVEVLGENVALGVRERERKTEMVVTSFSGF